MMRQRFEDWELDVLFLGVMSIYEGKFSLISLYFWLFPLVTLSFFNPVVNPQLLF